MMKVAGKNPSGNAAAFAVNASGHQMIEHVWVTEENLIVDSLEIRDTDAHTTGAIDISTYGLVSLRVACSLDQAVTIQLYRDTNASSTAYMYSATGGGLSFSIPASDNKMRIFTPDDLPYLPYINKLRLRISCSTAPTQGVIKVYVVGRR